MSRVRKVNVDFGMSRQSKTMRPGHRRSALRRKRVITIRVALPDLTVFALDEEFAVLSPSGVASGIDRIMLRMERAGDTRIALAALGPIITVTNDPLVLSHQTDSYARIHGRYPRRCPQHFDSRRVARPAALEPQDHRRFDGYTLIPQTLLAAHPGRV